MQRKILTGVFRESSSANNCSGFYKKPILIVRAMKKSGFIFGAFVLLTLGMSCSFTTPSTGGPVVKETRDVTGYTEVALAVPADVYVEQGSAFSFTIEGPADALKEIETVVDGSTLKIKWKTKWFNWNTNENLKIYITAPTYTGFSIAGSGGVYAKLGLKVENLELAIAGSGDIVISSVEATNLKASIAGSGDVKLNAGKTNTLSGSISGSGSISAAGVEAVDAKVRIAGSGDCSVWATGALDAGISGSGDIKYKGSPKLSAKVSGSGEIEPVK